MNHQVLCLLPDDSELPELKFVWQGSVAVTQANVGTHNNLKTKSLELCPLKHHVGQSYVAILPKYACIIITTNITKNYALPIHQNFGKIQLILEVLI